MVPTSKVVISTFAEAFWTAILAALIVGHVNIDVFLGGRLE